MNNVISLVVLVSSLVVHAEKPTMIRLSAMDGGRISNLSLQAPACSFHKGYWVCSVEEATSMRFGVSMPGARCGEANAVAVNVTAYHMEQEKEVIDQVEKPYVPVDACAVKVYAPVVSK